MKGNYFSYIFIKHSKHSSSVSCILSISSYHTVNLTQLCKPGSHRAVDFIEDEDDNQIDNDSCGCDGHSHAGFDLGVRTHGQCGRDSDAVHNHRKNSSKSYAKLVKKRRVKSKEQDMSKEHSQKHQKDNYEKDTVRGCSILIKTQRLLNKFFYQICFQVTLRTISRMEETLTKQPGNLSFHVSLSSSGCV